MQLGFKIHTSRLCLLLLLTIAAGTYDLLSQPAAERGHFLSVRNFSPMDYQGRPQNFDIAEDPRGILYFANSYGIILFDGIFWNQIEVNNGTVYSVETDHKGTLFVGGYNEIGYLQTNGTGGQEYVSLLNYLADTLHSFGEIWKVHSTGSGVYFKADQYLFRWTGDTIETWKTNNRFHTAFYVHNNLYLIEESRGLLILENDSLKLIRGGERFSDITINGMIPYRETGILIFTENTGIFHMISRSDGEDITLMRHFNEMDNFLFESSVSCALRINYNQFVIGSMGRGAVIYDQSNDQFDLLNAAVGLQDEVVYNILLDRRGNLWMALSNGISMTPVNSPVTSFGNADGIRESVEGISRYNERLFISTITGTYFLDARQTRNPDPEHIGKTTGGQSRFKKIADLQDECYACSRFVLGEEELLLIATYSGVSQLDRNLETEQILNCYPWYIYQSKFNPERVIIASENGVTSIYRSKGSWIEEPAPEQIEDDCRSVTEDTKGNVWIGTSRAGKAFRIAFGDPGSGRIPEVTVFDSSNNLPEGDIYISQFNNDLLAGTSQGLYRYDESQNRFFPDTRFGDAFSNKTKSIHRISVDHEGYLWLVTYNNLAKDYETGYMVPSYDGSFTWINEPFMQISSGVIHSIHHDPDGVTWLGGPNGLFRYDRNIKKDYKLHYNALIRRVAIKGDSLIFDGTFTDPEGLPTVHQNSGEIPVIRYHFNSVTFEYSAPNNEDGSPVLFSQFLEGFDEDWSGWSPGYRREYTNLHEKTYTFHVKARNMYGQESEETAYRFIIKPPWYRTTPVVILFVLTGLTIVWIIFNLYTRGLRSIIHDRTAEIREQKEQIEEKNRNILDSITYAQRIQSAMLTPGDYIDGLFPERFILYLPRDIVSGDFYWMFDKEGKIICVTADCTGHGVPGAMMSMMGMSYLNEITSREHDLHPDEILHLLRSKIVTSLRQKGVTGESQDGMDLALYIIDTGQNTLEFSGAQLPLYLFRKSELQIISGDKMPIGISVDSETPFTRHTLELKKGDLLYTFTDGFQDQFGGPNNKKFMIRRLRELLTEIHTKPMRQQKNILRKRIDDWMHESNCEQVDDITVIGVKI